MIRDLIQAAGIAVIIGIPFALYFTFVMMP